MKKILYFLAIAVLAGNTTSCLKTNKRKFSNDWKVTYEEVYFHSGDDQDFWTAVDVFDNETVTQTSTMGFGGIVLDTTYTGTVFTNTFTIKKDGTWSRIREYMFISVFGTKSVTLQTSSGNWSFLGKSPSDDEDFRRRDRVMFTTLKQAEQTKNYSLIGGEYVFTEELTSDLTADPDQETQIYVITESKRKELHLELEGVSYTPGTANGGQLAGTSERTRLVLEEQ
jgi:hypothetical protein